MLQDRTVSHPGFGHSVGAVIRTAVLFGFTPMPGAGPQPLHDPVALERVMNSPMVRRASSSVLNQ
jgi:hypothetical protein